MQVRELEFGDLFTATKIMRKVNIKPLVKGFGSINTEGKTPEEISQIKNEKGFDFFMSIIENIDQAEVEITKLMADLSGVKIEDVKRFKFAELKAFYDQFIQVNSATEIISFFTKAIGSMK